MLEPGVREDPPPRVRARERAQVLGQVLLGGGVAREQPVELDVEREALAASARPTGGPWPSAGTAYQVALTSTPSKRSA
jgi:hypothetical protein